MVLKFVVMLQPKRHVTLTAALMLIGTSAMESMVENIILITTMLVSYVLRLTVTSV